MEWQGEIRRVYLFCIQLSSSTTGTFSIQSGILQCSLWKREKGQIESLVGYVRRNALVPVSAIQSLDELNEHLLSWCEQSAEHDTVPHTKEKVADVWMREKVVLHPLPPQPFEGLHDLLLRQMGQAAPMGSLTADQVPVDLAMYRVQKADVTRYHTLTKGGDLG